MAEFNQMDEWIVDDLVDSIQETHTIWREPFERDENVNSLPRSGVTGQVFKTNLEGFARLQRQYDFTDPRWMTRAELMSLGWDITDDARGVVVGRDNYDKDIVVFNVSQAQPQRGFENSIKPWNPEIKEKQWFNVARADFILESSGANIKYGFKNSQYNTVSDNICLPYQSNFRTADDYYWTAFHELMHWTGSNSRLARNTSGNKNSPLYAREELVAELGAYMMCLRTGVSFDKSNASAYINGWAENMQLDSASLKKELTLAWSEARRACDFVSRNVLMNMKKNNIKLDNSGRVYLNVEKEDVKEVISLGARYDTRQYAFYITPEHSFAKFNKYLDEAHRVSDISVSLVTKTENEYEREDDKAEEIRRGIEAEANAPPVEEPAVDMNSNLARYIAYRAIKSEPQLKDWCDSDIISEIRDASEYLDSSHFAHDVADILKKHIVASIAKYSKNSTEADIYEHWDRDVNAYVQDADSIFVRMDSAISFLKYHLKDSFEDNVNHIRMLDEAYHDDAFLALINPKVENTVTEEAEQVAEVSENSEFVQKNENAETNQKTLLSVPFEEKDLAKELGAKFDRETKSWYVPEGKDLEPFERWKPTLQHEKMWIKAPYEMHEQIKKLGAKYDANAKCWYVPENVDLKPFESLKQDLEINKVQSEKTDTPIAFFVEKMREAGFVINKYPEINGRSTRVAVQGDKAGQTSGWYKIHTDGVPVCLFQNWRTGDGVQKLVAPSTKIDMSIDLEKVKVNTEAMAAKLSSQEEATKQLHAEVAKNVQERLAVYKESESTEYIQRKNIPVYKGIYATNRGATVVPLSDIEGNVKTMQTILPTGTKMFEKGGELKSSMHVINADNLAEAKGGIVICEGYATGATIREATNGYFGVVCAMTSHNLLDVAKAVSDKYPDKPLIIAGDNDRFNVNGNVGRLTAEAVAKELGAKVVIPEFQENDRGSDFNDLKKSEGLDKVKEVFRQLLQKKQEAKLEEKVEKKKSRSR